MLENRFSALIIEDPNEPGVKYFNYLGLDEFQNLVIQIKFKMPRYMALCLKTAQHFVEKAKNFYEDKFKSFDK